jgi:hypothetical protein
MVSFKRINFNMDGKETICSVKIKVDGRTLEWKHKVFPEGVTITDIVKNDLRLALNWADGDKPSNTNDKEEKEYND